MRISEQVFAAGQVFEDMKKVFSDSELLEIYKKLNLIENRNAITDYLAANIFHSVWENNRSLM